ncbi:putative uncharacterized protein DDB_G0271606 [Calliphora vicina]|uniref:putative uncharacterized protein DDB_G0271606 n=1 Tax=Calliphora vicina TaxID=7373 RepID=UPI00325B8D66
MKFFTLLLSVAFLAAGIAAVNGKLTNEQQHGKTSMAPKPAVKPTAAPLMTSTSAPTKTPKAQVSPTKAATVKTSMKPKSSSTTAGIKTEMKPTEKTTMDKEMKMEALPIEMPATVDHPMQAEESKPLAVTGFITKNGNIYEIEDKNGIGQIQSRQADDEGQHICNYGAVVIYSDVPCEQVTNVKVSEVEDKPALDQAPVQQMQQVNKPAENNDNKPSDDKENLDEQKKPEKRRRRRPSNKRRNNKKNKKSSLKKQKRPNNTNNNSNRKRLQQKRRRQQQQQQQFNRRKWEQEEDDDDDESQHQYNRRRWQQEQDDDDERQFQNQRRRKQNKNQKRQQAQRYTSDYDDADY